MRLIITRPEPSAGKTAEKLVRLGHEVAVSPLMEIVDTGADMPGGEFAAMLVTSISALRVLAARGLDEALLKRPLYAVGDATAGKAASLGFKCIKSASGTAGDLASLVLSDRKNGDLAQGPVLYACGIDTTPGLVETLHSSRVEVKSFTVYKANLVDQLTKKSTEWLRDSDPVGIMVYSARSAGQFSTVFSSIDRFQATDNITVYAISSKVAAALSPALQRCCKTAVSPDEPALIALIA